MRESTKNRAALAAIWTTAGVPRKEIAAKLGVSETRVRRLLRTPPAQEVTVELRHQLSEEVVVWRVAHLTKYFKPQPSALAFLEKMQSLIDKHLEKYGGQR